MAIALAFAALRLSAAETRFTKGANDGEEVAFEPSNVVILSTEFLLAAADSDADSDSDSDSDSGDGDGDDDDDDDGLTLTVDKKQSTTLSILSMHESRYCLNASGSAKDSNVLCGLEMVTGKATDAVNISIEIIPIMTALLLLLLFITGISSS